MGIVAAVPVAVELGRKLFGGPDRVIGQAEYYQGARIGTIFCPGPYDVTETVNALRANPSYRTRADSVIAMDSLALSYGPYDDVGRAGVLIGWAHGGTTCQPDGRHTNAASIALLNELRSLPKASLASTLPSSQQVQAGIQTFAAGVGGASNLLLILSAFAAILLLFRRV